MMIDIESKRSWKHMRRSFPRTGSKFADSSAIHLPNQDVKFFEGRNLSEDLEEELRLMNKSKEIPELMRKFFLELKELLAGNRYLTETSFLFIVYGIVYERTSKRRMVAQ